MLDTALDTEWILQVADVAAQLKLDQPVDVREEQGRIVIEPKRARVFALADLVFVSS